MSRREVLRNCADRIRLVRLAAGLDKASFAAILHVSHTHVGLIERDLRQPSRILAQEIADYFFINFAWLEHGRGWMYSIDDGYFTEELIKRQVRSGRVLRLVIVTDRVAGPRSHKAFLIEIPEGVISARVGEISTTIPMTPTTYSYLNILKYLQSEAVPVGHVHVSAEQGDVLNDLNLSSLIAAVMVENHILEKELEAIPVDSADRAFLEHLAHPPVKSELRRVGGGAIGRTLDSYHALLMVQPELKPAVQRLMFGSGGATRQLLRRVAEETEETNQLVLTLLEEMDDEAKWVLIRLLREVDPEIRAQFFRVLDALLQGKEVKEAEGNVGVEQQAPQGLNVPREPEITVDSTSSTIVLAKQLIAAGAHPTLAAAYTNADAERLMAELAHQGHTGPWPNIPADVDDKEGFPLVIETFSGREQSLEDRVHRMCSIIQSSDDLNRLLAYVTRSRKVQTKPD
jgi:DNA-binding XRE family transcriptional regulator